MVATARPLASRLGRFELRQLLGKSARSMTWLGFDAKLDAEVLLCLPRSAPPASAIKGWLEAVQGAARLDHPRLLRPLEIGVEDNWPYALYDPRELTPLAEQLASGAPTPWNVAEWGCDLLEGLAYAHEAGVSHLDIGLHQVVFDAQGRATLLGLAVGMFVTDPHAANATVSNVTEPHLGAAFDADQLRSQRDASERDLLTFGLLLHRLLAGHPALDDPDLAHAATRVGREIVRLPWTTPHTVPDTLRAIINRATDRQPRQRYLSARTLLRALHGWLDVNAQDSAGPLALLLDRLNSVGALPGREGLSARVSKLARMEGQRIDEMVDLIVQDPALVCEILRMINAVQFHGHGEGPVSSVRRAVFLVGMHGVYSAAQGLRPWPGALQGSAGSEAAVLLERALRRACVAGLVADALCPPGTDSYEALSAGMLQNLGRLLVLYHFPDEAAQITKLTLPAPPEVPGMAETPGMSEVAATGAVLGIEYEALGLAVAKHWGLDDELVQALRPLNLQSPVRKPDDRGDVLRAVASAANEALNAIEQPAAKQAQALSQVVQRYARAINITLKEVQDAVHAARKAIDESSLKYAAAGG
jgi:non-specific serine/threonine protein kinase